MAVIFDNGFETGDWTGWTTSSAAGGVLSIQSGSNPYNGTYCARIYGFTTYDQAYFNYAFSPRPTDCYVRFYIKPLVRFENFGWDTLALSGYSGKSMLLRLTSTGAIKLTTDAVLRGTTTTTLTLNQWNLLQVRWHFADADSVCEIKIGTETLTDTTNIAATTLNYVRWTGGSHNSAVEGQEFDCIVADNAEYPGPLVTTKPSFMLIQDELWGYGPT